MKLDLRKFGNYPKDQLAVKQVFHKGRWMSDYDYKEDIRKGHKRIVKRRM